MAMRCRCPVESFEPSSPTGRAVALRKGGDEIVRECRFRGIDDFLVRRIGFAGSDIVADGSPKEKKTSWPTYPICSRNDDRETVMMSSASILMLPDLIS